jgi:hypothetical protein
VIQQILADEVSQLMQLLRRHGREA